MFITETKGNIMILRSRQQRMISKALAALHKYGNTLCVAPTGAGKTVMMAAILEKLVKPSQKALVLQHTYELMQQNRETIQNWNPDLSTGIYKRNDPMAFNNHVTFAMVQSLCKHKGTFPKIDTIAIDEAHHGVAQSWLSILQSVRNVYPETQIIGFTATPNRGDRKNLAKVFSNVCDQIYLRELIADGHLVPTKTFMPHLEYEKDLENLYERFLIKLEREDAILTDLNMSKAASLMNTWHNSQEMIRHWKEKAQERKTIAFCTTIRHALDLGLEFQKQGINAETIHSKMSMTERKTKLEDFKHNQIQVLTNALVLTEGWDYPPVNCILLARPTAHKSTLMQMIGRGLRPWKEKHDCLVLDFSLASKKHGSLEQIVQLQPDVEETNDLLTKRCPQCHTLIPYYVTECPLCGFDQFKSTQTTTWFHPQSMILTELDIIEQSDFIWEYIDSKTLMAYGFQIFALVRQKDDQTFMAIGGEHKDKIVLIKEGKKEICLAAADCFMAHYESLESRARKGSSWTSQPPTEKQRTLLEEFRHDQPVNTSYHASAVLGYYFNRDAIEKLVKSL
jgi:DNA repair protein RadD